MSGIQLGIITEAITDRSDEAPFYLSLITLKEPSPNIRHCFFFVSVHNTMIETISLII